MNWELKKTVVQQRNQKDAGSSLQHWIFQKCHRRFFEQTARALSSIFKFTVTDPKAVANVATNTASMVAQIQDYINGINNTRACLETLELNACNGNGNAGRACTPGDGKNDQSYCHTHRRTRCPGHTRETCKKQGRRTRVNGNLKQLSRWKQPLLWN